MRKLTILVMVLGLLIWGGTTALAAIDGTVAVTYTVGLTLDMSVSPTSWSIGSGGLSETKITFASGTQGYFTVTNNANGPSYMDIKAAISGGCSIGAAAGANIYRLGYGQATTTTVAYDTQAATYTQITTGDLDLATIAALGTYKFDLQLLTPTSTTFAGVQQMITLTITAKTI